MATVFGLSDEQWAVIEPLMPKNQPGPERNDDWLGVSGILHVLTSDCRWRDCPGAYGPRTTVYNRFIRWSRCVFWLAMLSALANGGWVGEVAAIDSTYVKPTARRMATKVGSCARNRSVAGRPDDRDPRPHRCPRPPRRPPADAG